MEDTRTLPSILGHQITVFRDDHVGAKIERHGLYDKESLLFLLCLLDRLPDPVVLDIGANIGNHALAFATKAREVHAFEPIPRIHAVLLQNVRQNQMANIRVHQVALSDTEGADTIYMVKDGNTGASSFDRRGNAVEPVTVRKAVGDAFLAGQGIGRVDLVKIDVEAHEVRVLRGLMQTLRRDLPVITMEWNDPLTIERLSGSPELAFLTAHYDIQVLGSDHDRGWWIGKPFAFLRRKARRLLRERRVALYPFNPSRLYRNLLLIPKGKSALLDGLDLER